MNDLQKEAVKAVLSALDHKDDSEMAEAMRGCETGFRKAFPQPLGIQPPDPDVSASK